MSAYGRQWQRIVDAINTQQRQIRHVGLVLSQAPDTDTVSMLRESIQTLVRCADRWEALEKELRAVPDDA